MAGVVFRSSTGSRTACLQQDHRPRAEGGAGGSPRGTLGNLRRTLAGDASLAQPYSREESLTRLKAALGRARRASLEGKPYLIDAQVARMGVAWADKPWTPSR